MRRRGAQYWLWLNKRLPAKTYEDELNDGRQIEVQARITPAGMTQVFIGVYDAGGGAVFEGFQDRSFREPLACALKWGSLRAREIVLETQPFVAPHRPQLTLSPLITDEAILALRRMEMTDSERLKIKASDALAEYRAAHSAMLDLMRSTTSVDPQVWTESRERLRQAIDRRVWVQRGYLP
ncbi:hypothetical protein BJ917_2348 [Pseudomonas sp. WPR_5_2]|uniref:hypothetical protein n=1 Tax=Pseudomonas sp. WPR_5_2 TaxID=1907371 RepID=UPI000EAE0247|nr:hypothetical protein [Pseudomonas sp. WPR_5_2]RKS24866.1 hypothetical protein BJ917_2348 [Pseudomonas sp. WPR_5_2]